MNALIRSQKNVLGLNYGYYSGYSPKCTRAYSKAYKFRKYKFDKLSSRYSLLYPDQSSHPVLSSKTSSLLNSLNSLQYDQEIYTNQIRNFSLSSKLWDQPSSKVEIAVQALKDKQKEGELKKEITSNLAIDTKVPDTPKPVVKKPLKQRIWDEVLHYYHGFRLLFIDINICRKLLWRVLNGKKLTRRESKLLVRTTSDLFRLIPFSIFIIVPFMEFLLPVFIKFFPGMLPSTFQSAKEREGKLKQSLQVKLEVAKFLQKTLDEMAVQDNDRKSDDAKEFSEFFRRIKNPSENVPDEDIIKFSKHFEDEVTLDALSRDQLTALCRILEVSTLGTTNLLKFLLRMKLRSLAADDRLIQKEGVDSLNLYELQNACKARGMRAYGMSEEKMRTQLQEWIDLSLNAKVPPILLLLSRALRVPDDKPTTDKLKASLSTLPDAVATQMKAVLGEREGKIDNKTKIEIIKEEVRKITEEREEQKQVEKEKEREKGEILVDPAPMFKPAVEPVIQAKAEEGISSQDVEVLGEALDSLSKKKLLVEKETIKDLKEEIEEYKEDIEELREITTNAPETKVKESRAAKILYKKVDHMIGSLDKVLTDLEMKEKKIRDTIKDATAQKDEVIAQKQDQLVRIDELVGAIKKLRKVPDEHRLNTIEKVLDQIDADHDGQIKVDDVLKVIEAIGKENVNLQGEQVTELIDLIRKEEDLEAEDKIEKALAKSKESKQANEGNSDSASTLVDKAINLVTTESEILKDKAKSSDNAALLEDTQKKGADVLQKDNIVPELPSSLPPPIPSSKPKGKDKML